MSICVASLKLNQLRSYGRHFDPSSIVNLQRFFFVFPQLNIWPHHSCHVSLYLLFTRIFPTRCTGRLCESFYVCLPKLEATILIMASDPVFIDFRDPMVLSHTHQLVGLVISSPHPQFQTL